MIRSLSIAALVAAASSSVLAQGPIDTIDRGHYACELPGDAGREAGIPQPGHDFTVQTSSRYTTTKGGGTYLRRGNRVEMTSGPRKGEAYRVVRPGFLRLLDAKGDPGRERCVLHG
jgi:hypothetical protein